MTTITFSLERDVSISISTTFVRINPAPQLHTSILTYLGLRFETTVYLDCTAQWVLEHWHWCRYLLNSSLSFLAGSAVCLQGVFGQRHMATSSVDN